MADHAAKPAWAISNNTYDVAKPIVEIYLPGLGALYFALAQFWALPNAEAVVGSIAAFTVFFGLFLRASTKAYNKSDASYDGAVVISQNELGSSLERIEVDVALEDIKNKGSVVLKFKDASQE